jgi:hypothetical protein
VVRSWNEFILAALIYWAMKEGACSEQSARMTAMDAASKNACESLFSWIRVIVLMHSANLPCYFNMLGALGRSSG